VNEFSEQSLISCGGFGVVSKVMHKNSEKVYAIKKIALKDEELEKAFREFKLMKKLKSRFVVEHIDSWIEEKSTQFTGQLPSNISFSHQIRDPYRTVLLHIQMEFCCETLNEVIKQLSNELTENNTKFSLFVNYFICCALLTEIVECVNYIHRRNIIHRDLKPENILITDGVNGRFVKLGDFGLSVFHEFDNQSHTQGPGTNKYRAPEVMKTRKYDTKADIYSLGVIFTELFAFDTTLYGNFHLI
jgi:translation initiation factor 2-alpha kinase 4